MSWRLRLQNVLNGALGSTPREPVRALYPPGEFRRLIVKERDRAGRHNAPFSLVLIQTEGRGRPETPGAAVAPILRRLRTVDEIGWFDDDRLGILLPYTTRAGALQLVECLREPLQSLGSGRCEVYTFPDNRLFETGEA